MKVPKLKKQIIIFFVLFMSIMTLTSCEKKSLSSDDFPLKIDLDRNSFTVGEKMTFTATITNLSGKDINLLTNGGMPAAFFYLESDNTSHALSSSAVEQILKANEKIERTYEYTLNEAGNYILEVFYQIEVNDVLIEKRLDDIMIEVK